MPVDSGVLFGVDWYPEQWERSRWESDIRRIREFGFNAVRIMEFAWSSLEPSEGSYDFSIFDEVLSLLSGEGLKAVLGTPTATFPVWLADKDKGIFRLAANGEKYAFGTRRNGCYNNKNYILAAGKIAGKIAERYGNNPDVIGFQIDNEPGHEGSDRCFCESCKKAWHDWLTRKFAAVEDMNREWGTIFWGTEYSEFEQVPLPSAQPASGHNPGLLLEYGRFCSGSAVAWIEAQVDIVRRHAGKDKFITTNMYPPPISNTIDTERFFDKMDFPGWDNYPVWGEQEEPFPYFFNSFAFAWVRSLKQGKNFAVLEEMSGIQGHVCLGHLPPEKQLALWTNQAVSRGADKIFYFRWRTAPYGQEQLCYGLFDSDDQETERARLIRENMQKKREEFSLFANTEFQSQACLLYDKDNARLVREQYLSKGLWFSPTPFTQAGADIEFARQYAPFVIWNVNADVSSVRSVDLEKYRLVSLPLYQMADPNFVSRLETWVREGGVLVLHWRSGARDMKNWNIDTRLPGLFREMAGILVPRFESLNTGKVGIRLGLIPANGENWADIIETESAKVIARYSDRRKFYTGSPCVTVNSFGKGKVFYLGTSLDSTSSFLLFRRILKAAGLNPKFYGRGIEVVERSLKNGGRIKIALNHTPKAHRVLGRKIGPWEMKTFFTGIIVQGGEAK